MTLKMLAAYKNLDFETDYCADDLISIMFEGINQQYMQKIGA